MIRYGFRDYKSFPPFFSPFPSVTALLPTLTCATSVDITATMRNPILSAFYPSQAAGNTFEETLNIIVAKSAFVKVPGVNEKNKGTHRVPPSMLTHWHDGSPIVSNPTRNPGFAPNQKLQFPEVKKHSTIL